MAAADSGSVHRPRSIDPERTLDFPPTMATPSPRPTEPLPPGTRLLHVGPHKTGTATLQGAFHAGRGELRGHGVRYAGRTRQAIEAAHAITSLAWQNAAGRTPSLRAWRALVREVEGAREPRVVISSESFSNATAAQARRIAADLDPSRLHVVVTTRPIARVLPSRWQQSVQDGITSSFETWLRGVLESPQVEETGFWRCQRHDQLASRWVEVLGPERVTVVVVDDAEHRFVLDVFEALLDLPAGTLRAQGGLTNRSLTLPEVEAIRAFNLAFVAAGLGSALASPLHGRVMRRGAAAFMKSRPPAPDEPRVELPDWAIEGVRATAEAIVEGLRGSGARIVGSLDSLLEAPVPGRASGSTDRPPAVPDEGLPPSVAAAISLGVLMTTSDARSPAGRGWPAWTDAFAGAGGARAPEPPHVASFTTYQVAGTLAGRAWNRVLGLRDAMSRRGGRAGDAVERALALPRAWAAASPGRHAGETVSPADAAAAALDLLVATGHLRRAGTGPDGGPRLRRAGRRWPEPPELARIGAAGLLAVLVRRAARGVARVAARALADGPRRVLRRVRPSRRG
jgi:hypothetical protein